MRLSGTKLKELCAKRGIGLGDLLCEAQVSRTAYYSLARKASVLPKSIDAIARRLEVLPSEFLDEERRTELEARALLARAEDIVRAHRSASLDNVRHTLILLKKDPIDRLRRALLRAQAADTH